MTTKAVRERWGANIRTQRLGRKLSQKQLADRLAVHQTAVSAWEVGRAAPTVEMQLAIATVLDIDARLLFAYPQGPTSGDPVPEKVA